MLPLVESLLALSPSLPFHLNAFGRQWWLELERTPSAEGTISPQPRLEIWDIKKTP